MENINDNQIKEMQAQIDMLTKLLGAQKGKTSDVDSYIEFESLSLVPMYLATEGNGKGDIYSFEKFGDIQSIPMVDAKNIVRNNRSFVQDGLVYIKDEDFVAKENLKKYYDKILSADEMNNLLLCKRASFGERFAKITKEQQNTICGMLFDKIRDGKKVDEEVLFYINQLLGRDLKEEATNLQLLIDNDKE